MSEGKCEAGCQHYYGGELRHHKDCFYYKDSFTELYDQLKKERDELKLRLETYWKQLDDQALDRFNSAKKLDTAIKALESEIKRCGVNRPLEAALKKIRGGK